MSPRPHDGPAEEGLSSSLLPIVADERKLQHLRDLLGEFCHGCRNSLNGLKMSLYLVRRGARGGLPDCWAEIESTYQQVEDLFDHLQTIYRPMTVALIRSSVGELLRHHEPRWRSWYAPRGLSFHLDPPEERVVGEYDPARLGAGLDAMAAWRAQVGSPKTATRVTWCLRDAWIEIRWRELSTAAADDRGRLRARPSPGRVDVLALPLLSRILAAHGGSLALDGGPGFGVVLRWPRSRAKPPDAVA